MATSLDMELATSVLRRIFVDKESPEAVIAAVDELGRHEFHYVLSAFLLSVAERRFTGHEATREVSAHLLELKSRARYRAVLRAVDPDAAASLIMAGVAGATPTAEFPRIGRAAEKTALAAVIADDTLLSGETLDVYIVGSVARARELMDADAA
jgi:hypothetical protein